MSNIDLDKVLSVMKEELHKKESMALRVQPTTNEQYACLGRAAGIRELINKFEQMAQQGSL